MRVTLKHTPPYNLLDPVPHTQFLKHFIALIRYLAAGHGDVGYLRLPVTKSHDEMKREDLDIDEENAPERQMVLDDQEDEQWVKEFREQYES